MSDLPSVTEFNQPEVMQLSDCVVTHELPEQSPVDAFAQALIVLNRTASTLHDTEHADVVAQMLIVSVVSATETYFRHVLASLAARCPYCAENVSANEIQFGAVRSYPPHIASLALLEGVLFSSRGVLATQLVRFTRFKVSTDTTLSSAIASYDVVCSLRHSAAHWRGFLDSRAAASLGISSADVTNYRLQLSLDLLQRAFAVCDFLVRQVNDTLYRLTLRKWTEGGLIQLDDGTEEEDLRRCRVVLNIFASTTYCEAAGIDATVLRRALVADRIEGGED